jgi:hypothetical protein
VLLVRQAGNVIPQDSDPLFEYLPDPNFQAALMGWSHITKSGEGSSITVADAKAVGTPPNFWMENNKIASAVGFELFENVTKIDFGTTNASPNHNTIPILDLSRNTKLVDLNISRMTELTYVDLYNCAALKTLLTNYTAQLVLDLSANPELTKVNCIGGLTTYSSSNKTDGGLLQKIDLKNNPKLTDLQLSCNKLTKIDLSSQSENLTGTVHLRRNFLKTADFSNLQNVTTLNLEDNCLENIILPVRTNTRDLTVLLQNREGYGTNEKNRNNLSVLDASECFGISSINVEGFPNTPKVYIPTLEYRNRPSVSVNPNTIIPEEIIPLSRQ